YDGTKEGLNKIVTSVLGYEKNWGSNLNEIPNLADEISRYLEIIEKVGMKEAVKVVL
ncbi:mannitol-1-phosphate/altronate dehydrogenase, partial [Clostridium beijerinckii]|nr:mannitol-1-phosphate/altronate dehydrogenase [Clostridium beijerinckii]MBA2903373.1 mannitol-1-phosphate/altronate dehydrogenase [Clostridium beijerinckii]MBA2913223.1 mannitol-1-phosphate/altronate dehydrogenase [Clostridium beijerinckii]NSB86621.1 mannitol-1-phosphate/altronate dehydrogenase [Clostridium beijerinckii]NYE56268.1 mannitol-1-phosphate/altronate dehydrogenase [Clostridium beijerinckii]